MVPLTASQLHAIDRQHIWHPYSSTLEPIPSYAISRARGCRLYLEDGQQLIDGMSSWWAAIHGYNHSHLNEAVQHQLDKMAHVMFGGIIHEPAARLAETLVEITPPGLNKVFFSDSGSVSVEVAIKMAVQYWQALGVPQKHRLLSLRGGYHGDTFAAMSVCDPDTGMHHLFNKILPQQVFADRPGCRFGEDWEDEYIDDFKRQISQHADELAAVILEPIVQGAGGMHFYSPEFLVQVRDLCDQYNVLLIADEIATGFGRTGRLFACEWADISPDILCVGKALTGGYMTLAATLCTDKISIGICTGEGGVFMHGPTFMANPLACATANASIELLLERDWQGAIQRIEGQLIRELEPCRHYEGVADVRVLGAIGVVEMKQAVDVAALQKQFVDHGVWIRPFGKLVYVMPPYIISEALLSQLTHAMVEVLQHQ
ncbi:MAG: adenosylmethionine--8-amino-7-oxononanoate transaminase [Porticoccaceae bacterium]